MSKIVESYYETWTSSPSVQTIANMKCDVINIAFATIQNNQVTGFDCPLSTVQSLITAVHSVGKKVKLSVGGASFPLANILNSTSASQSAAQAVASFVKQYNIDGVDCDIED